jgi:hypothetical protein
MINECVCVPLCTCGGSGEAVSPSSWGEWSPRYAAHPLPGSLPPTRPDPQPLHESTVLAVFEALSSGKQGSRCSELLAVRAWGPGAAADAAAACVRARVRRAVCVCMHGRRYGRRF